jgi:exosome complex exonuclease DIS3/RRP44
MHVQEKKPLDTHWMVEEFMLLANIAVAEKTNNDFPDCAILRRHPTPAATNYKPVRVFYIYSLIMNECR